MIWWLTRGLCLLALLTAGTEAVAGGGEAGTQTAPAGRSAGETPGLEPAGPAVPAGEKPRPQACLDGTFAGPVRIQIGAVESMAYVGKTVTLPVLVKGICDLGGFSFWMSFDRRVVQLVEVAATPFLAGSPPVEFAFTGLQSGVRRQTIRGSRPPGSGGVDGRGILARLVFRGIAEGNTRVNLERLHLYDPQGEEIASFQVPVRITVLPVRVQPGDPRDLRGSGGQRP